MDNSEAYPPDTRILGKKENGLIWYHPQYLSDWFPLLTWWGSVSGSKYSTRHHERYLTKAQAEESIDEFRDNYKQDNVPARYVINYPKPEDM